MVGEHRISTGLVHTIYMSQSVLDAFCANLPILGFVHDGLEHLQEDGGVEVLLDVVDLPRAEVFRFVLVLEAIYSGLHVPALSVQEFEV